MINKVVWNIRGQLSVVEFPCVMGIINVNDNSFYPASRSGSSADILKKTEKMFADGALIVDIGAASTKPGSELISSETEILNLKDKLSLLRKEFPNQMFSIDTYNAETAKMAHDCGMDIINDISSGSIDGEMLKTAGKLKMPYIAMHMQGTPATMQQNPYYKNVTEEVIFYFSDLTRKCADAGISDLVIDPGFGFGKTIEQNFRLLSELSLFRSFQLPLLAGLSRKSMLYKTLGISPEESLNATTAVNTMALIGGADILRVHDVKEAAEAVRLFEMTKRG